MPKRSAAPTVRSKKPGRPWKVAPCDSGVAMTSPPVVCISAAPVSASSSRQSACERCTSGTYSWPSPIASRVMRLRRGSSRDRAAGAGGRCRSPTRRGAPGAAAPRCRRRRARRRRHPLRARPSAHCRSTPSVPARGTPRAIAAARAPHGSRPATSACTLPTLKPQVSSTNSRRTSLVSLDSLRHPSCLPSTTDASDRSARGDADQMTDRIASLPSPAGTPQVGHRALFWLARSSRATKPVGRPDLVELRWHPAARALS